ILTNLRSRHLHWRHAVVVGIVGLGVATGWVLGPNFLLIALNPTRSQAAVLYRQAKALEAAGRLEESRDAYRASVASKPDFWPTYWRLGELSMRLGDLPAAETAFRKYLD